MDKDLNQCEQLSALMDGELEGEALAEALRLAHGEESQATWELYHLVGDVLRSPELAAHASSPLLGRLREQLAQEPAAARVPLVLQSESPVVSVHVPQPAANASVFRWKMVAGIASMAAVAAIGWNSVEALRGGGAQLASCRSTAIFCGSLSSVITSTTPNGRPCRSATWALTRPIPRLS